jgi:hypothetical protein
MSALLIMLKKFYFYIFLSSAPIFGHLLRCESLEVGDYFIRFKGFVSA